MCTKQWGIEARTSPSGRYALLFLSISLLIQACGTEDLPRRCRPRADHPADHGPSPWVEQPEPLDPLDCKPQLLCIGTQKGGTTSLYQYLRPAAGSRYHPRILPHDRKEVHYFDYLFDRGG